MSVGSDGVSRGDLQGLIDRTWRWATARYITSVGSAVIEPSVAPVLDTHDLWTQATISKPLA